MENKNRKFNLSIGEFLAHFSQENRVTVHNWYKDKCILSKNDTMKWYATVMEYGNRKIEQVQLSTEEYLAGVANISEESIATVRSFYESKQIITKNHTTVNFSVIYTDAQYVVHEVEFSSGDKFVKLSKEGHIQGGTDITDEIQVAIFHSYCPFLSINENIFPVIYTDFQHIIHRVAVVSLVFIQI
ncbi:MAG TPA: hypothetical protein EYO76_02575 [Flavobacteriaceae bacterium]|nr:hypothetical protein [Flavobacteriaceae bacterium]